MNDGLATTKPDASWSHAAHIRTAPRRALAQALEESRRRTIALAQAYQTHLGPQLRVPQRADLNPPLWELGHVGWFQEWWVGRNPQRQLGHRADPQVGRLVPRRAHADAWYDSRQVAHSKRWFLPLPELEGSIADTDAGLRATLALLAGADDNDAALYFYRLVLLHEDMHAEAAIYMAQALGIPIPAQLIWHRPPAPRSAARVFEAGPWQLGSSGPGFAFDNELHANTVQLGAASIDAEPVRWGQYLPFIDAGGYQQTRWWCNEGWAWRTACAATGPVNLRQNGSVWQQNRYGAWNALDPEDDAMHLTWFEAQAWCRWAGRRLPSEAEWERAAVTDPAFYWGSVWEWTADTFTAYPGFEAHPYVDYSAPWFGSRKVLRGASEATDPRMRHPRYRNFFGPDRNDIHAGFRSCAVPSGA